MKIHTKSIVLIPLIVFFAFALTACSKSGKEDAKKNASGTVNHETMPFGSAQFPDNPATIMIPGICATLDAMALGGSTDTIKIGVAGAFSGELASYGLPTVNGVNLVVDEINSNGGLLGKQIELIVEDDMCKPEVATSTATRLVSDKVVAVIGHTCSGATKAAMGIYKDADIVCISPSATNPELTLSGDYPNFFRTIAHDAAQARLQVDFAINKLHVKKVAILHDKQDYGKGSATLAKQFFDESNQVEVVLFEGVTPGAVDYSTIVQKVQLANPDLVVWGGYHPEASRIVQQMRLNKMTTLFMGSDGLKDDTFIKTAGASAEGVYASGPMDSSKNPLNIKAIDDYKAKYNETPGAFFSNAYAAAQALTNAISKAGSTNYDAIVNALKTEYVETPIGKISFDSHGDTMGAGFAMYQVVNGVFAEVQ